jgi:citrate lyase subunit beta / citryl-CoA lyase
VRSLLFVPADSPRKLERALSCGADALIVDLEDSVAADARPAARRAASDFIASARAVEHRPRLYVRINAIDTADSVADLDAVVPARPDGVMLPKSRRGGDVTLLDARISTVEALAGLDDGETRILAITTETAASIFAMGSYAGATARLEGLSWGAEDLSADVGALSARDDDGRYTELYRLARTLCLAASAAAGVMAIDTVFTDFRDSEGLRRDCTAAMRDGFVAKMAIHPDQVPVINEVFTPTPAMIAEAQVVIRAFAKAGDAGVTSMDGRMLDRPHLRQAERVLARARAAGLA